MSEGKNKGRGKGRKVPDRKTPSPVKKKDDSGILGIPADLVLQDPEMFRQYIAQVANSNKALEAAKSGFAAREARIAELEGLPAIIAAGFMEFDRQASLKQFSSQYSNLPQGDFGRIKVSDAAKAVPFEDFVKRFARDNKVAAALRQYQPMMKALYESRAKGAAHQLNSEQTLKAARQEYAVPMAKVLKIDDYAKMRAEEPEKYQKLVASLPENWQKIVARMDLDAVAELIEEAGPAVASPAEQSAESAPAEQPKQSAETAKPAVDAPVDPLRQRAIELEAMLNQAEQKAASAGGSSHCTEITAIYREMLASERAHAAHSDNLYREMLANVRQQSEMQAGIYQAIISALQKGGYSGDPNIPPPSGDGPKGSYKEAEPAKDAAANASEPVPQEENPEDIAEPPEDEPESPESIDDTVNGSEEAKPASEAESKVQSASAAEKESERKQFYDEVNSAYEAAKEARKAGDYEGSISMLAQIYNNEAALNAFGRKDLLLSEYGVNMFMLGNYENAAKAFTAVLGSSPSEESAIIASHNLNVIISSFGSNPEEAARFKRAERGNSSLNYYEFVTGADLDAKDEAGNLLYPDFGKKAEPESSPEAA